ncbi:MAG: glycine--tRNA ligase subunit beta [Acidobacteriales bacterium 13_1_40CM_3_55_5]|nr:MAG: glycine--tRNA ligase subunit beta [Acidobacteriales bacterium 13_1_40CM_3_55_5]
MPDFLLEIGCEEIPARMIDAAQNELASRVGELLARESLGLPAGVSAPLTTPRRLSVASTIADRQMDVTEQVTGPAVKIAFKDGQPTRAAHEFARKAGVDVSQLEKIATPKGEYLAAKITKKGRSAAEILAESLPKEVSSIHWPKNMYWHKPIERFARPVRWLVAMLDSEVIPLAFAGVRAGNRSNGHRTLSQGVVQVPKANAYVERLREAKVLGRGEREQQIRKALDAAARTIPGARWREDKSLLETVVNLTESPSAVLGSFDPEFLELAEEVLVTVMRDHQKYFAVEDPNGQLSPNFLAVLNTDGDPKGIIRHGHERVLRARFNDARFFWQTDQKHPLRERVQLLKHVTFQKNLGTYYEKTKRVQRLCSWLSELIRQRGRQIRPGVIHKAALLAKADLTTELVKEFTELQGIVGGLYVRVQQLDRDMADSTRRAIADAIYDHYKPESMEDSVPRTLEGAVLAIADKADSIAGMFALGLQPTGSKDPFALRRQANGIVKTIAEHKLPLSLSQLFADARQAYQNSGAEKKFSAKVDFAGAVRDFFHERLEFYLRDVLGYKHDVVNAVLAAGSDDVVDAMARAQAITKVRASADFESISVASKRIKNILRQASDTGKHAAGAIEPAALQEPAERELAALIPQVTKRVDELRVQHEYEAALAEISKLRPTVDLFFDKVMVMVDDDRIRANRLAVLQTLLVNFSTIADFSEIVTESKA